MADRIRLLERRDIDELIILDVSSRAPRFDEVKELCEPLFCPITIGGGIKNADDIQRLLAGGADKVAINSVAIERPDCINEFSQRFGAQAITVAVNVQAGCDYVRRCRDADTRGAGEILLTSVERDGMMNGYDLSLIREVSSAVSIPVIAAGGCGTYDHMLEAIGAGAHAVASGAMFQFKETTPKGAARYLSQRGIQTRL